MSSENLANTENLKQAGLKITTPRLQILELFETTNRRHLNADDVYKLILDAKLDIGIATVYRVLTQFEEAGILQRHNFDSGHSVYELNKGQHHDHLLCIKCGKVDEFLDDEIEKRQLRIAKKKDFEITDHSLIIYGICTACKNK